MTDKKEWKVGQTSLRFESSGAGPGTVSSGKGDLGGVSYGSYQIASETGTLAEFIKTSGYASEFKDMPINSDEFMAQWKHLASEDPGFGTAQHDFIQRSHYEPQVRSLDRVGFDTAARGPAVQDMVWSTAVQYRRHTANVVTRGLTEAYGNDYKLESLTDAEIVSAVQDSKMAHISDDFRGSKSLSPGIEKRIETEKHALRYLAEHGTAMPEIEMNALERSFAPLDPGARGPRVAAVQNDLKELGYLSRTGSGVEADGHFGPATRDALVSFQHASGLIDHGRISVLTEQKLAEQRRSRDVGMADLASQSLRMPTCSLDDSAHPDHGMFKATRLLVHDLDRQHGREPDARSDNLAASLVVAARASGLERVDQVALSDDASRLWGVQRPPGVRDHFFDRQASTDTIQGLNTPITESSNRWPQAMQSYESVRQNEAQLQQQSLDLQQAQALSGPTMSRSI